ncbi:hypothetical protein FSP39_025295 [Pinctada imbricata]|uniref:Cytochrome P450 26A1-like n=1 Tax=Pinctada imbricata TaxID=66713 RepID=A0AA88Y2G1_PINIB|nr:hypothetical protein FSP39_025295 [Pinctada imbricata]
MTIIDYIDIQRLLYNSYVRWLVAAVFCIVCLPRIIRILWYWYCVSGCDSTGTDKPLPPGTMGYPLIGETVQLALKNANFYKNKYGKYGQIYKTHLLGNRTIRIAGAENIRKVLTGENTIVMSQWPKSVRCILGDGALSMSDGGIHKFRKRLVLKSFSHEALENYIPTITNTIRKCIAKWKDQGEILAFQEIKIMAFDLAMKIFVGMNDDPDRLNFMMKTFDTLIGNIFSLPYDIPGLGFHKSLAAKKILMDEISKTLDRVKEEGSPQPYTSAIHHLLELGDSEMYSKYEVCEAIQELLFTGHDTVTSAMNSAMLFLGQTPFVLKKIREELKQHGFLQKDCEAFTLKTISELNYTSNVTREVLRVAPSVGAGYRKALKTFEVGGYRVPKGWTVAFGIRDTQHTSPVFPDPEEFNPERWNNLPNLDRQEIDSKVDRFNYVPFGAGARTCVGREYARLVTRIFLIELCRTSDWTLHNDNPKMKYIPVPRPVDDLPVTIYDYQPPDQQ